MRNTRMVLVFVFFLIIGIGGIAYWDYKEFHPTTEDAYVQAHIVDIASRVSGPVVALHVEENNYVSAGDLLFVIDSSMYDTALSETRALYDKAVQETGASFAKVEAARSRLDEKEVIFARAVKDLERKTKLYKAELIAVAEFDNAKATFRESKASVESATADLKKARSELGEHGPGNARLRAASSLMRVAELELSFTQIRAPVSGWVSNLNLREGAMVVKERAQFSIVEDSTWWVEANFKETHLKHMRPGNKAIITIDMYPDLELKGQVESIGAGSGAIFSLLPPENATGNWVKVTQRFPVRIVLDHVKEDSENPRPLRVGASAIVTVQIPR